MAAARIINPYGDQYPDNNDTKEIVLQADGPGPTANPDERHVLLRWTNGEDSNGRRFTQIIQLTGGPGNYNFHPLQVKIHSQESQRNNKYYSLGQFTRAQRDQITALAKAVQFNRTSRVNNCQTWMRDLLEAMVNAGLLTRALFNTIVAEVPLKQRVPGV